MTVRRRLHLWLFTSFLILALLVGQVLGLMHAVVHAPTLHAIGASEQQANAGASKRYFSEDSHGRGSPSSWLKQLFSSHDADGDCQLYDQASHGSAAPSVVFVALPIALSSLLFDLSRGEALARWAALFQARGPPTTC